MTFDQQPNPILAQWCHIAMGLHIQAYKDCTVTAELVLRYLKMQIFVMLR